MSSLYISYFKNFFTQRLKGMPWFLFKALGVCHDFDSRSFLKVEGDWMEKCIKRVQSYLSYWEKWIFFNSYFGCTLILTQDYSDKFKVIVKKCIIPAFAVNCYHTPFVWVGEGGYIGNTLSVCASVRLFV